MAFKILVSHLSDHTRSLAEDPSVGEDKGTRVVFGLIVRAEDSGTRSDTQVNDSQLLIGSRLLSKPAVHPASWRLGGDECRFGFEQFTPAAADVCLGQHMTRQTHEDRVVAELG